MELHIHCCGVYICGRVPANIVAVEKIEKTRVTQHFERERGVDQSVSKTKFLTGFILSWSLDCNLSFSGSLVQNFQDFLWFI